MADTDWPHDPNARRRLEGATAPDVKREKRARARAMLVLARVLLTEAEATLDETDPTDKEPTS